MAGQAGVRTVMRASGLMNGDGHGGHAMPGSVTGASRLLISLVAVLVTSARVPAPPEARQAAWAVYRARR